ncbi:MAG: plasmid partitioning protein [Actinomycetota bacterium]|nr:plasmid partitioning protein [Actinomycetota bacterium]
MTHSRTGRRRLAAVVFVSLALVATACSGGSDEDGSSSRDDAPEVSVPSSADCTPARPADGLTTTPTPQEVTFDGAVRRFTIAVPETYDGTTALPLALSLHGWGGSGAEHEANTAFAARGVARDVVVVTPEATGAPAEWNMFDDPERTPDYDHVGRLVDTLLETYCLDPDRVFAVGHSNGAAFTGFLACREPYRFAAIAMVAATIPSTCPDDRTPSVLAISGDADPQVPYSGGSVGGGPTQIPGAVETMAGYLERYGCSVEVAVSEPVPGVRSERSSDCTSGAVVGFDTVIGGTHPWPGGPGAAEDPTNSQAGRDFDATGAILEFLLAAPPRA